MQIERHSSSKQLYSNGSSRDFKRLASFSEVVKFLSLLIASGTLAYMLVLLLWGLRRTFDIGDEGYYLLSSQNPAAYSTITSFPLFLAAVPAYTVSRILDLRYAQVFAQEIGALLLAVGYLKWMSNKKLVVGKLEKAVAIVFTLIGNLLLFAIFPFSLSYNSITGFLLFGSTGLLLWDTASETESGNHHRNRGLFMVLAGILGGYCLFAKFSAFIVFVPCALALLAILAKRQSVKSLVQFISGGCVALICYFVFLQSPFKWWSQLSYWLEYHHLNDTVYSSLVQIYLDSIKNACNYYGTFLVIALPAAFLAFFFLASLRHHFKDGVWNNLALALHLVLWSAVFFRLVQLNGCTQNFNICNLFCILALVNLSQLTGLRVGLSKRANAPDFPWSLFAVNGSLAALPFVCSAGSSNPILFQASIYLSSIFLLLFGLV